MSIFELGRMCVKIAGRDAGRNCVVVEVLKDGFVVIDGDVRRKKVNLKHLEPLNDVLEIGLGSPEEVKKAFEKLGLKVWEKKAKDKKEKPKKQKKVTPKTEAKPKKKAAKKPIKTAESVEEVVAAEE